MSYPVNWFSLAANCWTTTGNSAYVNSTLYLSPREFRADYKHERTTGDICRQPSDSNFSYCSEQCCLVGKSTGSRPYQPSAVGRSSLARWDWDTLSSGSQSPTSPTSLNFSIEEILREDFGRQQQHRQPINGVERLPPVTSSCQLDRAEREEVSSSCSVNLG